MHCKNLVPQLKNAASSLKADGVRVAAVDIQMNKGLASQLYPLPASNDRHHIPPTPTLFRAEG